MRLKSSKRFVVTEDSTDQENTPPSTRHRTKKTKLKTSPEGDSVIWTPKSPILVSSTPHETHGTCTPDPFPSLTPGILSPRSSLSNCTKTASKVIPQKRGKTRLDSRRITSVNPLSTLLVSDPKPSPCESARSRKSVSSYFSHRKRRGKRSERRFHDLEIPKLSRENFDVSCSQNNTCLNENYMEDIFNQWQLQINIGKNVLVYGFGSKLEIMEKFGLSDWCQDGCVLSIYAFKNPTVREVLLQSAELLLEEDLKKESNQTIISRIQDSKRKLYLLIHNIDASGIRKKQDQSLLAKLATCSNIVFIASTENVNSCRLWDFKIHDDFNWAMFAVHTCQNYLQESKHRPLALNPKSGNKKEDGDPVKAALLVLRSLVQNAQQIFILLANHKLSVLNACKTPAKGKTVDKNQSTGLTFDGLYKQCKEKFLASNPSTVRNHLKEFITHDLIQLQKNDLGTEEYTVSLDKTILKTVIVELTTNK